MPSLEEIKEESDQFAKQWRSQMARGFISILFGAFLLLVLSPKGITEYSASLLFITPLLFWAYKSPKNTKVRILTSLACFIASGVIYFGWIQNS
jgi:apolipoprotein N-acyltransferase